MAAVLVQHKGQLDLQAATAVAVVAVVIHKQVELERLIKVAMVVVQLQVLAAVLVVVEAMLQGKMPQIHY